MIKALSSILLLFLTACATPKKIVAQPTFSTIYKNTNGGSEKPGHLHITTNEEYIKLIEALKIDESEYTKLASVNFKTNDILVIYQGQKNTGGYAIDIASINWENDKLIVQTKETIPEAGKPVTMAITTPYCIAIIPKSKVITLIK